MTSKKFSLAFKAPEFLTAKHFAVLLDSRLTGAGLWLVWSLMAMLPLSLDVVLFWRLIVLLAFGLWGSAAGGGSGGVGSLVAAGGGGVGAGGIGVATGLLGM